MHAHERPPAPRPRRGQPRDLTARVWCVWRCPTYCLVRPRLRRTLHRTLPAVLAMKRISEIKQKREGQFIKNRISAAQNTQEQFERDAKEVQKDIHLIKTPSSPCARACCPAPLGRTAARLFPCILGAVAPAVPPRLPLLPARHARGRTFARLALRWSADRAPTACHRRRLVCVCAARPVLRAAQSHKNSQSRRSPKRSARRWSCRQRRPPTAGAARPTGPRRPPPIAPQPSTHTAASTTDTARATRVNTSCFAPLPQKQTRQKRPHVTRHTPEREATPKSSGALRAIRRHSTKPRRPPHARPHARPRSVRHHSPLFNLLNLFFFTVASCPPRCWRPVCRWWWW